MIEEVGQVVAVQGEFAWIESERTSTCGSCAVRKGCGTSAIAQVLGQRRVRLRVLNRIHARVGDNVVIGIAESGVVRGSLAVYAAPLLGLFSGALAGQVLGSVVLELQSDLPAVAGAIAGFIAALAWLKRFSRDRESDVAYQPVALRLQIRTGSR
ncbi:MAG: SoxR reducing system RseC family protein [Gammaproteobacteria bacterium]|jgi:sigma-E factor negative regulatory protein RseC|nr:SoxR reducing system RseC family protein [Gammaproteobacteria bacterium]